MDKRIHDTPLSDETEQFKQIERAIKPLILAVTSAPSIPWANREKALDHLDQVAKVLGVNL